MIERRSEGPSKVGESRGEFFDGDRARRYSVGGVPLGECLVSVEGEPPTGEYVEPYDARLLDLEEGVLIGLDVEFFDRTLTTVSSSGDSADWRPCGRSKMWRVDLSEVTARLSAEEENAKEKTMARSMPRLNSAIIAPSMDQIRMMVPVRLAVARSCSSVLTAMDWIAESCAGMIFVFLSTRSMTMT